MYVSNPFSDKKHNSAWKAIVFESFQFHHKINMHQKGVLQTMNSTLAMLRFADHERKVALLTELSQYMRRHAEWLDLHPTMDHTWREMILAQDSELAESLSQTTYGVPVSALQTWQSDMDKTPK